MRKLFLIFALLFARVAMAQTILPTTTQIQTVRSGPTLPAECRADSGNLFFKTTSPIGLHECLSTNTWTEMGSGSGSGMAACTGMASTYVLYGTSGSACAGDAGFTFDPTGPSSVNVDISKSLGMGELLVVFQAVGTVIGSDASVVVSSISGGSEVSGTIGTLSAVTGSNYLAPSAIATTVQGLFSFSYLDASTTVGTYIGLNINDSKDAMATVTDWYGILVGDIAGATNNYAIKTGTGDIVFEALKTTGAATGKKIVCVDTGTGKLYASTSGDTCAN